jgi:tetratricopeptide (TPR) repeat protein
MRVSIQCTQLNNLCLQTLVFLNRHEDAVRSSEIFLPLAPTAAQPYLIRGVSLHYLDRQLEAITCLVIGMHVLSLSEENPSCRVQFEIYLGKAKAALELMQECGVAPVGETPLPAPPVVDKKAKGGKAVPVVDKKEKGGKSVQKAAASTPSPSAAVTGSFDEDADARGFMRPVETDAGQAAAALQISLHGIDPADLELKKFLEQSLKLAASALATKKFNLALSIYRQVLDAAPKQRDALRGMIQVHEYHQRWQACLDTYNLLLVPKDSSAAPSDFVGLARVCVKLKRPAEAAGSLEKARQHLAGKQCDASLLAELQALFIKTLLLKGDKEEALSMVIASLQKDENSIALLMIYAELCTMREQLGEAVKVYLRCLVIDSTNVTVRRALSQAIQRPNGVAIAMQELSDAANSGPALAFMATLVKDYSAIEQSLGLYKRAVAVCPNSPSYSLNLIHTYELCYQYGRLCNGTNARSHSIFQVSRSFR